MKNGFSSRLSIVLFVLFLALYVKTSMAEETIQSGAILELSERHRGAQKLEEELQKQESEQTSPDVAKPKSERRSRSSRRKQKSWYDRLTYFANVYHEHRSIDASRFNDDPLVFSSELDATYDTTLAAFTVGGNIFKRTSVNWDITSEWYTLEGNLIETSIFGPQTISPIKFTRNKIQTELFVEHDLDGGYTIGGDAYFAQSRYRDDQTDNVFTDDEYGGGLLFARKFKVWEQDAQLSYILSHRIVAPGDDTFEKQTRTFHSVLGSYQYRWSLDLYADLTGRVSYYPEVDIASFWDAEFIYSVGGEITWYPATAHQFALKIQNMWIGEFDNTQIYSLNYEYEFGVKDQKRRKRRRRIPQLLIR